MKSETKVGLAIAALIAVLLLAKSSKTGGLKWVIRNINGKNVAGG